jgi:hypothetical protein
LYSSYIEYPKVFSLWVRLEEAWAKPVVAAVRDGKIVVPDDSFSLQIVIILSIFVLSPAPRAEVVRNARLRDVKYNEASGCYDVRVVLFSMICITALN